MTFWTDIPISNLSAVAGVPSAGSIEAQSFERGAYAFSDLLGTESRGYAGVNAPGGYGINAATTGAIVLPGGFSSADLAGHPGIMFASQSGIVSSSQPGTGGPDSNCSNRGVGVLPNGPAIHSTIIFCTPHVLSTPADRYRMGVGPAGGGLNVAFNPRFPIGFGIFYSDIDNGGNWVCSEFRASTPNVLSNSTVTPKAKTWYRLETDINLQPNRVTMQITECGTTDTRMLCNNVLSPNLNAGNPLAINGCSISIGKQTTTGIEVSILADYWSYSVAAPGRQW